MPGNRPTCGSFKNRKWTCGCGTENPLCNMRCSACSRPAPFRIFLAARLTVDEDKRPPIPPKPTSLVGTRSDPRSVPARGQRSERGRQSESRKLPQYDDAEEEPCQDKKAFKMPKTPVAIKAYVADMRASGMPEEMVSANERYFTSNLPVPVQRAPGAAFRSLLSQVQRSSKGLADADAKVLADREAVEKANEQLAASQEDAARRRVD